MSRIKDTFNQTFAEGGKGRQITFWVCIALAAILIVSAFVAIAIKLDKLETFEEVPTSAYARGSLDDTTGKIDADEADYSGIHTEGFYTVSGLKCLLNEDASISYQINWYDENKNFISASKRLVKEIKNPTIATITRTATTQRITSNNLLFVKLSC